MIQSIGMVVKERDFIRNVQDFWIKIMQQMDSSKNILKNYYLYRTIIISELGQ